MSLTFKCSECGGEINVIKKVNGKHHYNAFVCSDCGRERVMGNEKIIDMSETANLSVIMG